MSKKSKKPLTDEEKFALELKLEKDLSHHQFDYTILCKGHASMSQESTGSFLAKQRRVIEIYKKELTNITDDLRVAVSEGKKKIDKKDANYLVQLLNEYDKFTETIKMKTENINEIDYQIFKVGKEIAVLKTKVITDKMWEDRNLAGEKTLEALENKLEVQIKKFCTICADNCRLREQIDHLFKERIYFNVAWDKFIKNLSLGKKIMLDLIEQATIAYDRREEWCSSLQALRERAYKDYIAHINEMRELQRLEDDDKKLARFFRIKGQKRIMADMEEKERAERIAKRKELDEQVLHYTNILASVYEFAEETQIDVITDAFKERETKNFALFKYINELNREIDELDDTLGYLHLDIDEQRILMQVRADQQQETLEKLRNALYDATQEADAAEFALSDCDKKIQQLCQGTDELFKLCRCHRHPLLPLLGENHHANQFNIKLHLLILERYVQEYLCQVYNAEKILLAKKRIKARYKLLRSEPCSRPMHALEKFSPSSPCPLCVEHEMVSDVIDVLQRIYSRETTELKLAIRLSLPDGLERVHNVSACNLPKSRQIIQKRYQ